jgi:hypothetical protein
MVPGADSSSGGHSGKPRTTREAAGSIELAVLHEMASGDEATEPNRQRVDGLMSEAGDAVESVAEPPLDVAKTT